LGPRMLLMFFGRSPTWRGGKKRGVHYLHSETVQAGGPTDNLAQTGAEEKNRKGGGQRGGGGERKQTRTFAGKNSVVVASLDVGKEGANNLREKKKGGSTV